MKRKVVMAPAKNIPRLSESEKKPPVLSKLDEYSNVSSDDEDTALYIDSGENSADHPAFRIKKEKPSTADSASKIGRMTAAVHSAQPAAKRISRGEVTTGRNVFSSPSSPRRHKTSQSFNRFGTDTRDCYRCGQKGHVSNFCRADNEECAKWRARKEQQFSTKIYYPNNKFRHSHVDRERSPSSNNAWRRASPRPNDSPPRRSVAYSKMDEEERRRISSLRRDRSPSLRRKSKSSDSPSRRESPPKSTSGGQTSVR